MSTLEHIITPPKRPLEVPTTEEWSSYEQRLRLGFPADYRQCISRYGTGRFDEFIWILNPRASNTYLNLFDQSERVLAGERELSEKHGRTAVPFRLFPELGGLLPFGGTDNGDVLYWNTAEKPDRWTVVVNATRSFDYEEFKMNMTTFLGRVLSGKMKCKAFPDDFPSENPTFAAGERTTDSK
jgi:hypothetical protein